MHRRFSAKEGELPQDPGALVRAAEWAVANKFLTALTRLATPVCIVVVGWAYTSVTTLISEQQQMAGKVATLEQRITDGNANVARLNADLATAREHIATLHTQQQSSTAFAQRLDEFRQDLRDIRNRLDILAAPTPRYPQQQ